MIVDLLSAAAIVAAAVWLMRRTIEHYRDGQTVAQLPRLPRTPVGSARQVHRDGTRWIEADVPPRWHHCFPQSGGWHHTVLDEWWERCPCGAYRLEGRPWAGVNSYRRREYDFYTEVVFDG